MSTIDNRNNSHDERNKNFNFLPQPLFPEDFDLGLKNFIQSWGLSLFNGSTGTMRKVPVILLTQELWAERKMNWKEMLDEDSQEIAPPYIVLVKKNIVPGTEPIKRNIPLGKKFAHVKVPSFDGTTKGMDYYKIPQPVRIDLLYELRFVSPYVEDVNEFYKSLLTAYSHGHGYMNINSYQIRSVMEGEPSEDNDNTSLMNERKFQVNTSLRVHGKIVDPEKFEKVSGVKKIKFNMKVVNRFR